MIKFKKGGWVEQIVTFKTRFTDNRKWKLNNPEDGCEILKKLFLMPLLALVAAALIAAIPLGAFQWYALKFMGGIMYTGVISILYACLSMIFTMLIVAGIASLFIMFCSYCLFDLIPNYLKNRVEEKKNLNNAIENLKETTKEYYLSFKDKYCPKVRWEE